MVLELQHWSERQADSSGSLAGQSSQIGKVEVQFETVSKKLGEGEGENEGEGKGEGQESRHTGRGREVERGYTEKGGGQAYTMISDCVEGITLNNSY